MYGLIARTVGNAVRERREELGLTYAQLARRLAKAGQTVPTLGLRNIEAGVRRVDVDELVALALVLDVSPATLLMPQRLSPGTTVHVQGLGADVSAERFWRWLTAEYPLSGSVMAFYNDALPVWERDQLESKLGAVRS